ncbi:hypothetical protein CNECB9_1240009 [Cupriavidus necator]|uniref:Uncharacterized protein n=1 Tax=Cupriavidus necator TaxID=106590 RepID=A0A1K0J6T2_CUPNE|nr:hypothetical protein CNECB9_1240009 [Cupriavidus necator]
MGATVGASAATADFAGSQATKNPESVTLSGLACVGDALEFCGAEERNRTPDLLITNELLYRLSYFGNMFR